MVWRLDRCEPRLFEWSADYGLARLFELTVADVRQRIRIRSQDEILEAIEEALSGYINMRATWVCSRNDMIVNTGVLLAAELVIWLVSPVPDIAISLLIAATVILQAWRIVVEAEA